MELVQFQTIPNRIDGSNNHDSGMVFALPFPRLIHHEAGALAAVGDDVMLSSKSLAIAGLLASALVALTISPAQADIILSGDFNFRENRINAPLNWVQGDTIILGLNVIDSTTGLAPAGAIVQAKNQATNEIVALNGGPSGAYSVAVPYSAPRATGNWLVEVTSDVGSASRTVPNFGTGPGTGAIPGVNALSIAPGAQPVFTWSLPAGLTSANDGNIDRLRTRIDDSNLRTLLDDRFDTTVTATSYTAPSGVITHNGAYLGSVMVEGFTPYDRSRTMETFVVDNVGAGGQAVNFTFSQLWRDNRQQNSIRFSDGDKLVVNSHVDVFDNTYVYAANGGVIVTLPQQPEANRRFEFAASVGYDASLTDAWTVTAWNGAVESTVQTNAIGNVGQLPFVINTRIEPNFQTPTIHWDLPVGNTVPFDNVQIGLFDDVTNDRLSVFGPGQNRLFETLDPTATSFQFAPGQLQQGGKYVARVQLTDFDGSGNEINRSLSFFNFTPIQSAGVGEIFLPTVDASGAFQFDFELTGGVPVQIDPFIAVGYDYRVGVGDPLFASVMLPSVGDDIFEVVLFDSLDNPLAPIQLLANVGLDLTVYDPLGIDHFRILGIETAAGLDPADTTAFITTLTFVGDGRFTGTMTPITVFVEAVPEPGTLALFAVGLAGLGVMRRRRTP